MTSATRPATATMRAIVQHRYGSSDVLELADVATPSPGDDEVLVRVHAAGLDKGTWHLMEGLPRLHFASTQSDALAGADALVVVTEWKEFRNPDFDAIKAALKQPLIFDGRNIFDPALMRLHGIEYSGIGRGVAVPSP